MFGIVGVFVSVMLLLMIGYYWLYCCKYIVSFVASFAIAVAVVHCYN